METEPTRNTQLSQLCKHCRDGILSVGRLLRSDGRKGICMVSNWSEGYNRVDWYPSLTNLEQSGLAGCKLCQLLRAAALSNEAANLIRDQGVDIQDTTLVRIQLGYTRSGKKTGVVNRMISGHVYGLYYFLDLAIGERPALESDSTASFPAGDFNACDDKMLDLARCCISLPVTREPRPRAILEKGRSLFSRGEFPKPLKPYALDEVPVRFMKYAIGRCVSGCQHVYDDGLFLPTRLLDARGDVLRIVSNVEVLSKDDADLRYIALSYCWGDSSQLTLDTSTEPWLSSGFSFDVLTQVQKDTVSVAKVLAVPYIWIDALCIRQDDSDDWNHESASMDKVYSNAYLTICSVSSTNCEESFLHRKETRINLPNFDSEDQEEIGSPYYIQSLYIIDEGDPYRSLQHEMKPSTWFRRAWTYQEEVLSTRRVFFNHSGIHFRCPNFESSEYLGVEERLATKAQDEILLREDFENPEDEDSLNISWAQVISDYSRREITHALDLFPALSGLTRRFARTFGDEQYIAGLWRKYLFKGLMWRVEVQRHPSLDTYTSLGSLVRKLRDKPYIGPSWSWVGREQAIYPCDRFESSGIPDYEGGSISLPEYKRLDATCTPATQDIFGKISSAALTLETNVFPLDRGFHYNSGARPPDKTSPLFELPCFHLGEKDGPLCRFELDWKAGVDDQALSGLTLALIGSSVVSEKYSRHPFERKVTRRQRRPFGLILCSSGGSNNYLRVGIFSLPEAALTQKESDITLWDFFKDCEVRTLHTV